MGERVARRLDSKRRPRRTARRDRIKAGGVVDVVIRKPALLDFLRGEISRKLVHNRADHFHVRELFRA